MSRLLIKTLATVGQPRTNRPLLAISSCSQHNEATRRHQVSPTISTNQIPTPFTKQLILQNSKINDRLIKSREPLLSSDVPNTKVSQDKNFISEGVKEKQDRASLEQLTVIADAMTQHLPRFFNTPHPFNLYTKDVVFMDNIRQVRLQGLAQYATRLALVKLYHRLRYTTSRCELLNLVKHPEESSIKIRWRIVSKPGITQFIFFFYKYHSLEVWNDGVSTLYVNKDGKIYCHACDNIDLDENKREVKKTIKNTVVDSGLNV